MTDWLHSAGSIAKSAWVPRISLAPHFRRSNRRAVDVLPSCPPPLCSNYSDSFPTADVHLSIHSLQPCSFFPPPLFPISPFYQSTSGVFRCVALPAANSCPLPPHPQPTLSLPVSLRRRDFRPGNWLFLFFSPAFFCFSGCVLILIKKKIGSRAARHVPPIRATNKYPSSENLNKIKTKQQPGHYFQNLEIPTVKTLSDFWINVNFPKVGAATKVSVTQLMAVHITSPDELHH